MCTAKKCMRQMSHSRISGHQNYHKKSFQWARFLLTVAHSKVFGVKYSSYLNSLPSFILRQPFFLWLDFYWILFNEADFESNGVQVRVFRPSKPVLLQFSHTLTLTLRLIAAFNVSLSVKAWLNCRRTSKPHSNISVIGR